MAPGQIRIWSGWKNVLEGRNYRRERTEERFANETQIARAAALNGTIVEHAVLSRGDDESIRSWALCDTPEGPVWIHPDGTAEVAKTPYPWCRGNPTRAHCVTNGYCRRTPSCGD